MMMTVVAVIIDSMPVVPVIRRPVIVAIVRIGPVVSVWIIAVSVSRVADFDRNLRVRTLHGNESQSTCHQCNQEKLFHTVFPPWLLFWRRKWYFLLRICSTLNDYASLLGNRIECGISLRCQN